MDIFNWDEEAYLTVKDEWYKLEKTFHLEIKEGNHKLYMRTWKAWWGLYLTIKYLDKIKYSR